MIHYEIIKQHVEALGYKLWCFNPQINDISRRSLEKVLDNIEYEVDTKVYIKRKPYIVEINIIGNEVDLDICTLDYYNSNYGNFEEW